LSIQDLRWCD